MEVVVWDERWICRITPSIGIEMQAEHEIGFDGLVDEFRASANFRSSVEEFFGEQADGYGISEGVVVSGEFDEVLGTEGCDGLGGGSDEGDFGAHFFELWFEDFGDEEGHIAFGDRFCVADLEPATLDFRPFAADVARVDGDVEIGEGLSGWSGREVCAGLPVTWCGEGFLGLGEMEDERRFVQIAGGKNFSRIVLDGDEFLPSGVGGKDVAEVGFEIGAGNRVLKCVELGPIRNSTEDGEYRG